MKAKDVKPGHYDEIVDRAHCLRTTAEGILVEHPCYTFDLDIQAVVEQITAGIDELYQMAANKGVELEEKLKHKAQKMYRMRQRNKKALKKAMKGEL